MKTPCKHCPYRHDVKPFVTQERHEELAYHASNPYNSFPCHKTTEYDDDTDDMEVVETSKECAGFMALQHFENGNRLPDGFIPSDTVYGCIDDMIYNYDL